MYFRCSENYWLLISPYWSRAINLYSIHRFLYFNFFSLHQLYHPSHLKSLTMRDLLAWITNLLKHWCLSNKAEKTARPLGRKARQNMKREQILADNDIGWFQRKQPSLNSEFTRGGDTPGNSWWGCAARFLKSWPDFRPKNVIFHTRFQTRPLKSIPVFRPAL